MVYKGIAMESRNQKGTVGGDGGRRRMVIVM
jgi:hypothetical protein